MYELFSNFNPATRQPRRKPPTLLIDSDALENSGQIDDEFKRVFAPEIKRFKEEYARVHGQGAAERIEDSAILREVVNTVGKRNALGAHIRCVVSVSMLTEGWDANTVTHILGIRPFRSQLLCEQVVGRGLRRRDYTVNPEGRLEPEYAEVYGVPFASIPSDRTIPKPKLTRPPVEVRALPERWRLAIRFPKLDGYRIELPDQPLAASFDASSRMEILELPEALWVLHQGVAGTPEETELEEIRGARAQEVTFRLAKRLLEDERFFGTPEHDRRPWLFPQLVDISRRWMGECLVLGPRVPVGLLLFGQNAARAAEKIYAAIAHTYGEGERRLVPILRRFDRSGSTEDVHFITHKATMAPQPEKSHLNHVVLDGVRGNSWEEALATFLEHDPRVRAYVKNERLGFTIPYVHEGRTHDYIPDFLVSLQGSDSVERTLVVEVSGGRKSPGPTEAKAGTARNLWSPAVNNTGDFGLWGYAEVHNPKDELHLLSLAIDSLLGIQPSQGAAAASAA
jgi:type III restriction enzyme